MTVVAPAELTIHDLADQLGVHRVTVRRWVSEGEIEPLNRETGRHTGWRFAPGAADALVAERRRGHGPECPIYQRPFGSGRECECIECHCAEDFVPGGFLGTCGRCGRRRFVDGRPVR